MSFAPDTEKTEKESKKNSLGLSGITYGLGAAGTNGLISFVVSSVALLGILTVGEKVPGIRGTSKWLSDQVTTIHDTKYGLIPLYNFFKNRNLVPQKLHDILNNSQMVSASNAGRDNTLGEKTALAVLFGSIVSHVVTLPSIESGRRKVQKAVELHDAALADNKELQTIITLAATDPDLLHKDPVLQKRIQEILGKGSTSLPDAVVTSREKATAQAL